MHPLSKRVFCWTGDYERLVLYCSILFLTFLLYLKFVILADEFGAWRSPVAHHFGVVGVAGSNPVAPTFLWIIYNF
jgi:hypothetical protein